MHRRRLALATVMICTLATGLSGAPRLDAQAPPVKRTDLVKADLAPMDAAVAQLWLGELAPGASTGKHAHPTSRFVYVVEGAVILEIEGQAPRTFNAGEAFEEAPRVVHNFRNASDTAPAKALGFQVAAKGQALQY